MFLNDEKVKEYSKRVADSVKLTEQKETNLVTLWNPLEVMEKMRCFNFNSSAKLVLLYALIKCAILEEEEIPSVQDICYTLDLSKEDVKESLAILEKNNFISGKTWNCSILQTVSTSQPIEKIKETIKMLDL